MRRIWMRNPALSTTISTACSPKASRTSRRLRLVARLKAGTEMSPKGTAEYAALIVKLQGDLHKLRLLTRSLIRLSEVRDFEARILINLRSALIPISSELRDELAGCNDPNRCQDILDARIYGALRQVARYNPD